MQGLPLQGDNITIHNSSFSLWRNTTYPLFQIWCQGVYDEITVFTCFFFYYFAGFCSLAWKINKIQTFYQFLQKIKIKNRNIWFLIVFKKHKLHIYYDKFFLNGWIWNRFKYDVFVCFKAVNNFEKFIQTKHNIKIDDILEHFKHKPS